MAHYHGIFPVVPTPLHEDGSFDPEGARRLLDFMVASGVHGLYALGTTGEEMLLPFSTRVQVARTMAQINAGRLPLLMGAGSYGVQDALEFFDAVKDCRIDGVHVIPYDHKLSDAAVERFFSQLADRSPFPLWMYHNPDRGRPIPIPVAAKLKNHPNIVGAKVAGYSYRYHIGLFMLQDENFQCLGSGTSQFLSMMALGGTAHTTSDAASFPELILELYRTYTQESLSRAREKMFEILRFMATMPKPALKDHGETSVECKFVLSVRGICQEFCAEPYRLLRPEEKEEILKVLKPYLESLKSR
jgi:dihydrodipicolinate synthase/N-acetylneuraminate lyase